MTAPARTNRIFISYRRDDSAGYAGRLYDDIVERVGDDRVFRDIDTIEPGQDFVAVLDEALKSVSVLLVVIGQDWVGITDASGQRRLEKPDDFVRMEVAHALSSDVRVIPVLVEDVRMPRPEQLPEDLQPLTRRQYHELSDSRWEYDVGKLLESIKEPDRKAGSISRRAVVATGAGAALFGAGAFIVWLWPSDDDPPDDALAGNTSTETSETGETTDSPVQVTQVAPYVPLPPIANHLIPDSETLAWDDLGPRQVKGVVYHRTSGTLVEVDQYLRTTQPTGLVDLGVGHETGRIWMWNDPVGAPHPGVSANRSPWANGPVQAPHGDAPRFIEVNGTNAVNRDLVSITITGNYEDGLGESCKQSVAWLTAYFADLAGVEWSDFPHVIEDGHMFVMLHNEFNGPAECPGPVVIEAAAEIVELAGELLRQYQTGT